MHGQADSMFHDAIVQWSCGAECRTCALLKRKLRTVVFLDAILSEFNICTFIRKRMLRTFVCELVCTVGLRVLQYLSGRRCVKA